MFHKPVLSERNFSVAMATCEKCNYLAKNIVDI